MKFAKLENGKLVEAPKHLSFERDGRKIYITNPTEIQLIMAGYKPIKE